MICPIVHGEDDLKSLWLLLVVGLPLRLVAADDLPKPFTFARYQAMMDHSPFAVATAVAAPAATPNFAKDLFVANAAHLADEDVATIASSADKNFKEYVTNKHPNDHGYIISSMEWSDRVGATKVTIEKDHQFATLPFNQALLSQPLAPGQGINPMPNPQPGITELQRGQATLPQQTTAPMPIPALPTPPPRVRGVIPRNPNAPSLPNGVVRPSEKKPEPELG